jgi:flagellar biosynthesis/type III secretory pathway protein FliH
MNSSNKYFLSAFIVLISVFSLSAQPPGGRGGRGGGPDEMVAREKQALYKQVTDLTDDQKLLIDGIYEEFTVTLKEKFEEARESGKREGMRETMKALRDEKNALMADVLNESQYATYEKLVARRKERREQRNPEDDSK